MATIHLNMRFSQIIYLKKVANEKESDTDQQLTHETIQKMALKDRKFFIFFAVVVIVSVNFLFLVLKVSYKNSSQLNIAMYHLFIYSDGHYH